MRSVLQITHLFFAVALLSASGSAQDLKPMDARADPAYEIATVKPSDPANTSSGFQLRGRRVIVLNETTEAMLVFAYGIQKRQIVNAPAWVNDTHYDITGTPDAEGQPNVQQMRGMLRKLLEERFQLHAHEDRREMPVYVLEVAKNLTKLLKSTSNDEQPDQTGNGAAVADYRFTNHTMEDFAGFLQFELDRPVVDETALTGRYNFTLKWTRDPLDKAVSDAAPSVFSAMQEQLGLKLEPAKRPAKVLVIDRLERPSSN